jgi:MFS family permease
MSGTEVSASRGLGVSLRLPAFRRLWAAQSFSLLGDGFSYVAFAWVTLSLTRSSLALGAILATQAIPRAALTLVGGAITDKISPRIVMLMSSCARAALMVAVAAAGFSHLLVLWMLFLAAAVFGAVDAFFQPARSSILPSIIEPDQLRAANGLLLTGARIASVAGPAAGGIVVAASSSSVAFLVDGICFVLCAYFVAAVREQAAQEESGHKGLEADNESGQDDKPESLPARIRAGLAYAWSDPRIRSMLVIDAAVTFCFSGPFTVGFASLAKFRLADDAIALGALEGSMTAGTILGALIAIAIHRHIKLGVMIAALAGWLAIGMLLMAVTDNLPGLIVVALGMGLGIGYQGVFGASWVQREIPQAVLGRVIAVDMVAGYAVAPVSLILAGVLGEKSAELIFVVTAVLLAIVGLGTMLSRSVRGMS